MDFDLVTKYDLRVPRYTSYPTAPHFSPAVDSATYGRWLTELAPDEPVSLYSHIAYCAELCWFCGCHTKITQKYAPVADYLDALFHEIDTVASLVPGRLSARHIHFGGGSPTVMTAEDFARLLDRLRHHFDFVDGAEVAVEMDPRTTDLGYVNTLAASGVTRASIGVQDFDQQVQVAINRVQPHALVARVIDWLRAAGVHEINMDLVYGLPHQTVDGLMDTIDKAVALQPRRLSLFGYAHVPWMKKHQRLIPEEVLPDAATRWRMYFDAVARLQAHGYVAIGLDHFAAPDDELAIALSDGSLRRNFQGYTTDTADVLLAFGASGIGALPQGYVGNEMDINTYKRTVREGRLAVTRGVPVSDEDRLRRDVISTLMCHLSVDLAAVAARHGRPADTFDPEIETLAELEADGIVLRSGRHLRVSEGGRPLVRAVAAKFDRYLKVGEARHSRAV